MKQDQQQTKIYTVRVTQGDRNGVWYNNKIGREFQARLSVRDYGRGNPADGGIRFQVNALMSINPLHCVIVSEHIDGQPEIIKDVIRPEAIYSNPKFNS